MEMLYRLYLMIGSKVAFIILLSSLLMFNSCENTPPDDSKNIYQTKCNILGELRIKGVKITLKHEDNDLIEYVAVSDASGVFSFDDIVEGKYSVSIERQGYRWGYMIVDGEYEFFTNIIEIKDRETKSLEIILYITSESLNEFEYEITDVDGLPIYNSVSIEREQSILTFRLYNKTGNDVRWTINGVDRCYLTDGRDIEYIFSYFSETSGVIPAGQSILVSGMINKNIYSFYENHYIMSNINKLTFSCGNVFAESKEMILDIDF